MADAGSLATRGSGGSRAVTPATATRDPAADDDLFAPPPDFAEPCARSSWLVFADACAPWSDFAEPCARSSWLVFADACAPWSDFAEPCARSSWLVFARAMARLRRRRAPRVLARVGPCRGCRRAGWWSGVCRRAVCATGGGGDTTRRGQEPDECARGDVTRRAAAPTDRLAELGEILYRTYRNGQQVFTLGNGGSASTASHMAADLDKNTCGPNMRRFRILSLNDNQALLTALANDLGYENVFSEQLKNLIRQECCGEPSRGDGDRRLASESPFLDGHGHGHGMRLPPGDRSARLGDGLDDVQYVDPERGALHRVRTADHGPWEDVRVMNGFDCIRTRRERHHPQWMTGRSRRQVWAAKPRPVRCA